MGEGMLKDVDDFDLDPDGDWDQLSNELDGALPNVDRWDVEIRKLLPNENRSGNAEAVADVLVGSQPVREEPKRAPQPIREVSEAPVNVSRRLITSDKQLLFFILKYKDARKICEEAGISLKILQQKVAYLSYKLKKYIDVVGLYRDTSPVELKGDGILVTRGHLVETPFHEGDRFRVDFKEKYIILTKL